MSSRRRLGKPFPIPRIAGISKHSLSPLHLLLFSPTRDFFERAFCFHFWRRWCRDSLSLPLFGCDGFSRRLLSLFCSGVVGSF